MADAAAPAVRARAAVPHLGAIAVGAGAAIGMGALAAADGGYFPPAWGWTALLGLWIAAAWLLLGRVELGGGRLGLAFLGGFAGLAVWTWLSLLWTENTTQTALESFRLIAYLGAAAALMFVVRREHVPALLRGVLTAITFVSIYGLATRFFPDRLGTYDPIATYRLSEPVGYWNGLGILAAIGALLALGILARDSSLATRCLAGASFPILLSTMFFTFSRGAWVALGIGFLAAFALDPRRLHLVVAAVAVAIPSLIALWAGLSSDALTDRDAPFFAAVDQGRVVALIVLGCAALGAVGAGVLAFAERRIRPSRPLRLAFAAFLAVLAVGAIGGVLVKFNGPVATVEKAYDAFRVPATEPEDLEQRLFSFSGSYRPELWEVSWNQFREAPILGTGPGTYEQYWNQERPISHIVTDAHNVYLETAAELGVVGLAFFLIAFGAPLVAAFGARREPLAAGAFGAFAAYLVHAGIDWDWEMPGLTVPALACAVGLVQLRPVTGATFAPTLALRYGATAVAVVLAAVALGGLVGASATSASQDALAESPPDLTEAEEQARKARGWARWSSEPWQRLGEAQLAADDLADARESFRTAIEKEPTDWELWYLLAEASTGAERGRAIAQASRLNPRSPELEELRQEAP